MAQNKSSVGPVAGLIGMALFAIMIYLFYITVSGAWSILAMFSTPLFVLAMILNFATVKDYFSNIVRLLKEDTGKGILYGIGTYLGFPLVSAYLAFKAYANRTLGSKKKADQPKKGEYIKYEDVEKEEEDDFLDLEGLDKNYKSKVKQQQAQPKNQTKDNGYDDLFA